MKDTLVIPPDWTLRSRAWNLARVAHVEKMVARLARSRFRRYALDAMNSMSPTSDSWRAFTRVHRASPVRPAATREGPAVSSKRIARSGWVCAGTGGT